ARTAVPLNKWTHIAAVYNGSGIAKGVTFYVNGKKVGTQVVKDSLHDSIRVQRRLLVGRRNRGDGFVGRIADVRIFDRAVEPVEAGLLAGVDPLKAIFNKPASKRTPKENNTLRNYYLERQDEAYIELLARSKSLKAEAKAVNDRIPTSMVMREMTKPRETFLLMRGQYDMPTGDPLKPAVPAAFPPLPEGAPNNRLGLARWLVAPNHPLTARVAVNRYWQMLFGKGIVLTSEDFGAQGEWPSHPQLLDWLATTFVEDGWDVKKTIRRIVTSATYRQASSVTPEVLAADPQNRLLARGPRFRLQAELIRDNALAVSGLLNPQIGGPSVKPYQPPGLWLAMGFGETRKNEWSAQEFIQDHGPDLYRRGMYTFWKRSVPPPNLAAIDAPNREVCTVRRAITNTPISALVLMNDVVFIEAARVFAERIIGQASRADQRIAYAFRVATARYPDRDEATILLGAYDEHLRHYRDNLSEALELISAGEFERDETLDPAEHAAWTIVASMILNLDETITKG
ncbi:MAG: DUF1553 domain-containing protein, partial [Planctomycetota bacterium]